MSSGKIVNLAFVNPAPLLGSAVEEFVSLIVAFEDYAAPAVFFFCFRRVFWSLRGSSLLLWLFWDLRLSGRRSWKLGLSDNRRFGPGLDVLFCGGLSWRGARELHLHDVEV